MDNKTFKQRMIEDMFKILKSDISNASKEHILDMYCWILTERKGTENKSKNAKFKGCDYWSKAALDQLQKNKNGGKNYESGLRHEHVVPRKLFRDYVQNILARKAEMDTDNIDRFFIGCVVTKEEADTIDREFKDSFPDVDSFADITEKNLWDRYKNTIPKPEILKVEWESKSRGWEKSGEESKIEL